MFSISVVELLEAPLFRELHTEAISMFVEDVRRKGCVDRSAVYYISKFHKNTLKSRW